MFCGDRAGVMSEFGLWWRLGIIGGQRGFRLGVVRNKYVLVDVYAHKFGVLLRRVLAMFHNKRGSARVFGISS